MKFQLTCRSIRGFPHHQRRPTASVSFYHSWIQLAGASFSSFRFMPIMKQAASAPQKHRPPTAPPPIIPIVAQSMSSSSLELPPTLVLVAVPVTTTPVT
mmetsp:Transcript_25205/g.63433  ORF Transcript_25205/g.63433 Transcript_25205/m.63433 type:complete len:99 (+) Transcript_25205:1293-1589(+)